MRHLRPGLSVGWAAVIIWLIAGLVIFLVGFGTPTYIGLTSYSPLSGDVSASGGAVLLARTALIGALMLIIGLVGAGFLSGVRMGRRHGAGSQ